MVLTLKQARLLSDYSQRKIADSIGICEDSYRRIEKNPELATISQAKKISRLLGIPYELIFFGTDSSLTRDTAS